MDKILILHEEVAEFLNMLELTLGKRKLIAGEAEDAFRNIFVLVQ